MNIKQALGPLCLAFICILAPVQLLADSTVYVADRAIGVMKADLSVGTATVLLPQVGDTDGGAIISMDGTDLLWSSGSSAINHLNGTVSILEISTVGSMRRIPGTNTLIIADLANDKVYTAGIDGSSLTQIATGLNLVHLTPDTTKIYYLESGLLKRMDLNASNQETLSLGGFSASFVDSIAAPTNSAKIFWTDGTNGLIQSGNKDGSGTVSTLLNGLNTPQRIVTDNTFLYWIESKKIRRMGLDGSNPTTIVEGDDPKQLIFDDGSTPHRLIWFDLQDCTIRSIAADGTGSVSKLLTSVCVPERLTIDYYNNKVYVANTTFGKHIQQFDLDGANLKTIVDNSTTFQPEEIVVDPPSNKLFWIDSSLGRLFMASLDGGTPTSIVQTMDQEEGLTLDGISNSSDPTANSIFYTERNGGKLIRVNRDGTSPTTILSGLNSPAEMTSDPANGKVYFVERGSSAIVRTNFDGSGGKENVVSSVSSVGGIRLDPDFEVIYWTNRSDAKLRRANLDGTEKSDVLSLGEQPKGFDFFWDADGDGTADQIDGCKTDANKIAAGDCGCGVADSDANGNEISDCLVKEDFAATFMLLSDSISTLTHTALKDDPDLHPLILSYATALIEIIESAKEAVVSNVKKATRQARGIQKSIKRLKKAKGKKFNRGRKGTTRKLTKLKKFQVS